MQIGNGKEFRRTPCLIRSAQNHPVTQQRTNWLPILAVKKALNKAFHDSGFGTPGAHEEGGWIYANNSNKISVVRAASGGPTGLPSASTVPGSGFNDLRLVGVFHTHPFTQGQLVVGSVPTQIYGPQAQPSDGDLGFSARRGNLPGIIAVKVKGRRFNIPYSGGPGPADPSP